MAAREAKVENCADVGNSGSVKQNGEGNRPPNWAGFQKNYRVPVVGTFRVRTDSDTIFGTVEIKNVMKMLGLKIGRVAQL